MSKRINNQRYYSYVAPTEPRAPRITYACPNCGQVDSHAENCPSNPRVQTATPWQVVSESSVPEGDATIRTVNNEYVGQVKRVYAHQAVVEHNQHTKLVAALRGALSVIAALQDQEGANTLSWMKPLIRQADAALANEPEGEGE